MMQPQNRLAVAPPFEGDAAPQTSPLTRAASQRILGGELRSGNLEVRLAICEADVEAVQALRYRIFYEEMAARPTAEMARLRRDIDRFDPVCDHLMVLDHGLGKGSATVIGTYRLIRRPVAERLGGFYSATEFDISLLAAYPGEILELGRSCVDAQYRTRPAMQLLWRGIAAYVFTHEIALMFGCASLPGVEPQRLAIPLSYLYHHHLAPPALRPRALDERYVDMRLSGMLEIDPRLAFAGLPPLIKGYLRVGAFIGDGAVVDGEFNTTDVCIVVKTDLITDKYYQHYMRGERDSGAS